jgi:pyruvate/2-oxoglutarate dehydrogenase complex dihydrolipoamide acyltransferase (E2) component
VIGQLKNVVPAHMTVMAGWTQIRETRKAAKESMGKAAPSPTVMVAWALVQAMKRHPIFCCIAVALQQDALDTAIIQKASQLDQMAFQQAYDEAIEAAREGNKRSKASVPLILTSMGGYSVREALPLVVPPAIATLFLGEAHWEKRGPDEHEQQVALCMSFDHRWLNGAAGAHFLQDVKREMESYTLPVS